MRKAQVLGGWKSLSQTGRWLPYALVMCAAQPGHRHRSVPNPQCTTLMSSLQEQNTCPLCCLAPVAKFLGVPILILFGCWPTIFIPPLPLAEPGTAQCPLGTKGTLSAGQGTHIPWTTCSGGGVHGQEIAGRKSLYCRASGSSGDSPRPESE